MPLTRFVRVRSWQLKLFRGRWCGGEVVECVRHHRFRHLQLRVNILVHQLIGQARDDNVAVGGRDRHGADIDVQSCVPAHLHPVLALEPIHHHHPVAANRQGSGLCWQLRHGHGLAQVAAKALAELITAAARADHVLVLSVVPLEEVLASVETFQCRYLHWGSGRCELVAGRYSSICYSALQQNKTKVLI